ncbi:hypothetical protein [Paraburkholderia acidisoli]|uniref:Uncharacterized protein n=1 Tax=Paraburkholderia acidisoli TaxID=2571748 RepID=A0A7Z2JGN7_9BURK|nr:hypothetical protein [Paraburkholderia acidisoli]QGZ62390.1 hypothetical protein FAZ98_12000 [Paraburkholderia acidisoli]
MASTVSDNEDIAALIKARTRHAIRASVIAAVLDDPVGVWRLLELPAEELGRRIRSHLWDVSGVATVFNYDLPALREEGENLRKRYERIAKSRKDATELLSEAEKANPERSQLIRQRKVLCEEDFRLATNITKKKLEKDVAGGRVFSVDFGGEPYYPAFFIPKLFDRNDFASVFRRLDGLSAWSKWDFFTSPIESQQGATPLQLLMVESMEQVLKAADAFVNR